MRRVYTLRARDAVPAEFYAHSTSMPQKKIRERLMTTDTNHVRGFELPADGSGLFQFWLNQLVVVANRSFLTRFVQLLNS